MKEEGQLMCQHFILLYEIIKNYLVIVSKIKHLTIQSLIMIEYNILYKINILYN